MRACVRNGDSDVKGAASPTDVLRWVFVRFLHFRVRRVERERRMCAAVVPRLLECTAGMAVDVQFSKRFALFCLVIAGAVLFGQRCLSAVVVSLHACAEREKPGRG